MSQPYLANVLPDVRSRIAFAFIHTATVTRKAVGAVDADGQPTKGGSSTPYPALPCLIESLNAINARTLGVIVDADGMLAKGLYQMLCAYGTDVRLNDTLTAADELGNPLEGGMVLRVDKVDGTAAHALFLLRTYA